MKNYRIKVWLHHLKTNQLPLLKALDELTASQWWSLEAIQKYQLTRLRDIVDHAYNNTLYYKQLFKRIGLTGGSNISSLDDIKRIPVLTKAIIRDNLDDLTTRLDNLVLNQTGGSTGIPLKFYNSDKFWKFHMGASMYRAYTMGGYRMGDSMGVIWGFDKDIPPLDYRGRSDALLNLYPINSFKLTDEKLHAWLARLKQDKVRFIKGYASSLYEAAHFIINSQFSFDYKIKAVFSEAERLDNDKRALIENAFGTKVFNYYGCREFSTNAVECSAHEGLHLNFEHLYTEILDDSRILLTSFMNRGTIFIRYEIGDCADKFINESCACGRHSYRINRVFGRVSDHFLTPDGKKIHGEYITHLFYPSQSIKQFQVIQKSYTDFDFKLVTDNKTAAEKDMKLVTQQMNATLGYVAYYRCHFVDEIEKTRTGKMKFTVCEITGA